MEEEIYEFREGELLRYNPETKEWEKVEKKKDYAIVYESSGGVKKLVLSPFQFRTLLKTLVKMSIPFSSIARIRDGKMEVEIDIKPTERDYLTRMDLETANKMQKYLEPLSDIIKSKVGKTEEIL
jgi:hypothetical protein